MQDLTEQLLNLTGQTLTSEEVWQRLTLSLLIIAIIGALRVIIIWIVRHETQSPRLRYTWTKITNYVAFISGLILVGRTWWVVGVSSLATFLGIFSAGIAIALQGPITDLAGWLFILIRRPFKMGDRIQIGESAGDVIDMRPFQFTMLEIGNWVNADQSTGRIIHIPNRKVFNHGLANYTQGFDYIWNELAIHITFESDWGKAKRILQTIANRHAGDAGQNAAEQVKRAAEHYFIHYSKFTPIVYTQLERDNILLTIRYLCNVRRRRSTAQEIGEDILKTFAQHPDIEFAYPTQRFYHRDPEKSLNSGNTIDGVTPNER